MGKDNLTPEQVIQILARSQMIPGEGFTPKQVSEALCIAVREVEKLIPKPPIRNAWSPNRCPTCYADLGSHCNDGWYDNPWHDRCPECGQRLDYNQPPAYRYESPDGKIFDTIEDAVKNFMCPGVCSPDCPLSRRKGTVLPNGHGCHMCHPDYAKLHPGLVAMAMGYRIVGDSGKGSLN